MNTRFSGSSDQLKKHLSVSGRGQRVEGSGKRQEAAGSGQRAAANGKRQRANGSGALVGGQIACSNPLKKQPQGKTEQSKVESSKSRMSPLAPSSRGWLSRLGAIAIVCLSTGAVASAGWLAVQLIVNPQSVNWINRILPGWIPASSYQVAPQTVRQIRTELHRGNQAGKEMIPLGSSMSIVDQKSTATDWLMPIQQADPKCQNDCDRLVELRVYQHDPAASTPTQEPVYHLVSRLSITGLEESFVVAPLVTAQSDVQGSSRAMPLTQITRYEGTVPPQGTWLNLSGREDSGGDTLAYGQILHYNPKRHHLGAKLDWSSTIGEAPVWKKITGDRNPELLVNQTVGMEPQFEMYQVKPLNFVPSPVQLQPVSLTEPTIKSMGFANALQLARGRLWSTSLQWLESLKREIPAKEWTTDAQAQMDLIRWHAQATSTQAEGSWASPSQQVLANLIDGRWERALTVFEASQEASQEMVALLKADTGRLENRMESALQVGSDKPTIRTWMALLIAAQKGKKPAIAWLKAQSNTTPTEISTTATQIKRMIRSAE
jgi:hypothetical protein